MTDKIIEGVINEGKNRIDGKEYPFWNSFIISWLIINWKVIYITASLNSVSLNDKVEQIVKLYPAGNFSDFTHPLISLAMYPLLASFFAVTVIPIINHFYLLIRKQYRVWDATIEIQEIQKEKEVIKEEQDLQKEKEVLQNSEQKEWDKQYDELLNVYKNSMDELSLLIYDKEGYNYRYDNSDFVRIFEVHNLITRIKGKNDSLVFQLTEKGKYFLKKKSLS